MRLGDALLALGVFQEVSGKKAKASDDMRVANWPGDALVTSRDLCARMGQKACLEFSLREKRRPGSGNSQYR